MDRDLADGQHRNPDPVDRPGFFTTACFHTLAAEVDATGFAVYGVEGPGRPLRQEWANGRRREQILSASRAAETGPSLTGFSDHLIAAAAKPRGRPPTRHSLAGRLLCCQPGSALSGRRPHPLRHHRWPDTPGRFTGNGCHGAHNQIVGPISVVQRQSGESS